MSPSYPRTEGELQRTLIEAAQHYGFLVHHDRPARTASSWRTPVEGDAGFPDLVLVRNGVGFIWELKSERAKLSDAQLVWHDELTPREGVALLEYGLVRPSMLDDALAALDRVASDRWR
jgi:hypothetical protein